MGKIICVVFCFEAMSIIAQFMKNEAHQKEPIRRKGKEKYGEEVDNRARERE